MNNHIQTLAEQAKKSVPHGLAPDKWIEVYNEKLAGLVVQECIATVEGMEPGYKDYRDQIEDAFRRDCVAEIKHKFGVEL
jgi:hypothetical protein